MGRRAVGCVTVGSYLLIMFRSTDILSLTDLMVLTMQRLAVKRLTDVGIGVLTPTTEQLANPFPHAMALATLDAISFGAPKELLTGARNLI